ncbi:MAG: type II toxin-antitoxin system MqsA family antitoxin [Erythrobacter sp.]
MTKTRIHPETGEILRRDVREQLITFGPLSETVEVSGWYPDGDGDAIHTGADLKAANEVYKKLRSAYGQRVRDLRLRLNLTQEQAGAIIGGGRRAFQKYEAGTMAPSDAAIGLIAILERCPEQIETLKQLKAGADGATYCGTLSVGKASRSTSQRKRARRASVSPTRVLEEH